MSYTYKVVLVHGWNMNRQVMVSLAESFDSSVQVVLVNLPGHGGRPFNNAWQMSDWVEDVRAQGGDEKAHWVGWSLGGSVILALAEEYPALVQSLTLIAATPAFVVRSGWEHAVPESVFEQFQSGLIESPKKVIARFMALMLLGDSDATATRKFVAQQLGLLPETLPEARVTGLSLLQKADFRIRRDQYNVPVLMVLGENDALVPVAVADDVLTTWPAVTVKVVKDAGHLLFVSDAGRVSALLQTFWAENQAVAND